LEKIRRGIQSVEIGSHLLLIMARHLQPLALKDLAHESGMATGKVHPYLVSFSKVGFVTQDPATGRYELGPLALQLGLAKLHQLDPLKEASPLIADLVVQTGQGVALAVWGNLGPTIVRLEEPARPLHVNMRIGTVMSLVHTATGRLFAAYMPPKIVDQILATDPAGIHLAGVGSLVKNDFQTILTDIRERELSRAQGNPIPGLDAFCAPVFDSNGAIALGVLVTGPSATFDSSWTGPLATATRNCAIEISRRLGYSHPKLESKTNRSPA